jgi:hypothetical protein
VKANKEMTRTHAHKSHNLLLLLSVLFSILWFQKLGENSYFFCNFFQIFTQNENFQNFPDFLVVTMQKFAKEK